MKAAMEAAITSFREFPKGWSVCSVLGMGLVFYATYGLAKFIRLHTRSSSIRRYLHQAPSSSKGQPPQAAWALVTGASDGIGKALCLELAREGFNLVIHGRNAEKLAGVQDELFSAAAAADQQRRHPRQSPFQVRILVINAFKSGDADAIDFDAIAQSIKDIHLTVLVNCAGAGPHPAFGTLESYSTREILDVINLNATFPALMSAVMIPHLLRSSASRAERGGSRGGGLILNIASVTDTGMPLVSFYGAGKAFGHTLSMAVAREMQLPENRDNGPVEVMSLRLGAVTDTARVKAPSSLWKPDAKTMAKAIVAKVGCGEKSVVPYWPHGVQQALLGWLPTKVMDGIMIDALRAEKQVQDMELAKKV